jgi:hypothetical protein
MMPHPMDWKGYFRPLKAGVDWGRGFHYNFARHRLQATYL